MKRVRVIGSYIVISSLLIGCLIVTGCPGRKESGSVPDLDYLTETEKSVYTQINEYRESINLNALEIERKIVDQARIHSKNMGEGSVPFGHEGFESRVTATGLEYERVAENVAYNKGHNDPATVAVKGWLNSPGHLKNIKGKFNLTGVGVVKNKEGRYYFTQIFMASGKQNGDFAWFDWFRR